MPNRADESKFGLEGLPPSTVRLYNLLDSLVALRLDIANDTEGERALSATLGLAKAVEVRMSLDRTIRDVKRVIDSTDPRKPPKPRRRPLVPIRRAGQRGVRPST